MRQSPRHPSQGEEQDRQSKRDVDAFEGPLRRGMVLEVTHVPAEGDLGADRQGDHPVQGHGDGRIAAAGRWPALRNGAGGGRHGEDLSSNGWARPDGSLEEPRHVLPSARLRKQRTDKAFQNARYL